MSAIHLNSVELDPHYACACKKQCGDKVLLPSNAWHTSGIVVGQTMQRALSNFLRFALVLSLSDRERFVSKLTTVIENVQQDPEKAEMLAKFLTDYMKDMKDSMNRERTFEKVISKANIPDKTQIEDLTKAIQALTKELKMQKV